jgi:hypothetical protein
MRTDQDWFHPKIIEDQLMQQINILKEKTEKRNTNDRVLHKIKFYSKKTYAMHLAIHKTKITYNVDSRSKQRGLWLMYSYLTCTWPDGHYKFPPLPNICFLPK